MRDLPPTFLDFGWIDGRDYIWLYARRLASTPFCRARSLNICRRPLASRDELHAWCLNVNCLDPEGRRWSWAGEVELRLLGAAQPGSLV